MVAGGLFAGCGSSASGDDSDLAGPSAAELNDRFDELTGIRLRSDARFANDSWSLLSLPGTEHFDRFGAFSIYIVKEKDARQRLLHKSEDDSETLSPNSTGYAFRRNEGSDSYSLIQRFGENVVLVWQAGESQEVDASYHRLTAAIKAAATGDDE